MPGKSALVRPRPRPGRPKAAEAGRVGERILSAATHLLFSQGYARTTMDAVARAAGASSKTLYQRYSGKAQILTAVLARYLDRAIPAPLQPPPGSDPRAILIALGRALASVSATPEAAGLNRLIFAESHRFPDLAGVVATLHERAVAAVEPTLERLESLGLVGPFADRRTAAMLFLEMTASAPRLAAMLGHDPSPRIDGLVETAVDLFLRGCAPDRSPGRPRRARASSRRRRAR